MLVLPRHLQWFVLICYKILSHYSAQLFIEVYSSGKIRMRNNVDLISVTSIQMVRWLCLVC